MSQNTYNRGTNIITAPVSSLDWEPRNGILLLVGSLDGKIKVWNVESEKNIGEMFNSTHESIQDIHFNPLQSNICAASSFNNGEGRFITYDLSRLQVLQKFKLEQPNIILNFAFNHNATMMVAGCSDGNIRLFDMNSSVTIEKWTAHSQSVSGVMFSLDETCIYSVGVGENSIICWSAHSIGEVIRKYNYEGCVQGKPYPNFERTDISFDPDGKHFIVGSQGNHGVLYNVYSPDPLLYVGEHSQPVTTAHWHPVNNTCITGSMDGTVIVSELVL